MKFSSFFINRPRFAAVLSLVILIAGLVALPALPVAEYPEVVPPTIQVKTIYAGADPFGDRRDRGRPHRTGGQRGGGDDLPIIPVHLGRGA